MLFRTWLAFSIVIGIVQAVLAALSILQHDAILSDLLGRRVSVIAQTTAAAFQPIVDLGLPMSMVRGGDGILERARAIDPGIRAAHAFNPSGIVAYSTAADRPGAVPPDVLRAMQLADGPDWSVESDEDLFSGFTVQRAGQPVGAVVVAYPRDRLAAASRAFAADRLRAALAIWAAFSALAYLLLRLMLAGPRRAIARLGNAAAAAEEDGGRGMSLLGPNLARLDTNLGDAERQYGAAERALHGFAGGAAAPPAGESAPAAAPEIGVGAARSLAAGLASRLTPAAALCIVGSALVLGAGTLRQVNRSFEPEFAARTELIGTVVSENVQRAVSGGVPIDRLVGAATYFGGMLERLPEVAHIAVVAPDGRTVLEAGDRPESRSGEASTARRHPILHDGEEIGAVTIGVDPRFVAKSFRDAFLDMGVVILVSVLLSFEVMVLLTSRSVTAPLDRLQRLAAMQAAGDFSMRAAGAARGAIGRLTSLLSSRAESLHARFLAAWQAAGAAGRATLEDLGRRFGLSTAGPAPLRLIYFTSIRLALFLFAAADELPASFLVLYTRAASNPWGWIEGSVLLSLPIAGGLVAGFIAAPLARKLSERLGSRRLLMLASLPVIVANVGMFWADSVPEIVLWRTITGFGYALVVLACEDYVIDTASRDERDRALGVFSTVYFGGIFAGTALGGVLADRFGQATVFLVSAAFVAASLALIAWLTSTAAARPAETPTAGIAWRGALANRRFAVLLIGIVMPAQVMDYAFVVFLVPLVLDSLGVGVADIARCLMLYCLAVAAVGNLPGRLVEVGLAPAAGAVVGLGMAGAALVLVAAGPTPLTMVVALTVAGVGFGLVRWAAMSVALEIAETDLAHLGAISVLGTLRPFERVVSIGGLFVIAALAGRIGYAGATGAVAFCALAGAALFLPVALAGRRRGVAE